MIYDLHTHSTASDGSLEPAQLIHAAIANGINTLALTDHDTLAGIEQARIAALDTPLEFIPGIELSAQWRSRLIHVVGLSVDVNHAVLKQGIQNNQALRWQRAQAMLENFRKTGIELEDDLHQLLNGATPTRPHFAAALVQQGHAKDRKQAFKKYLLEGKPGFAKIQWPAMVEVIDWIKQADGIAVLAHPTRYKLTRSKLVLLLGEAKAAGLDAIEVATSTASQNDIEMLARIALEEKLYASSGSDFHAPEQRWARLGKIPLLPDYLKPVWQHPLFKKTGQR